MAAPGVYQRVGARNGSERRYLFSRLNSINVQRDEGQLIIMLTNMTIVGCSSWFPSVSRDSCGIHGAEDQE